jgi:hypothetical protein
MLSVCAALAALLGCAALALSQARHWKAVAIRASPPPRAVRLSGWVLLIASLVCCIACDGASFAALLWPLLVGGAALVVAAALTWRPSLLRPLAAAFARRRS